MKVSRLTTALSVLLLATTAHAEEYILQHQHKKFTPQELVIPADQKVKIIVKNLDAMPMEFESAELKREKVIGGNGEAVLYVGPLDAGSYAYFDDFDHTITGHITAKATSATVQ